jgi:hypothetical protein
MTRNISYNILLILLLANRAFLLLANGEIKSQRDRAEALREIYPSLSFGCFIRKPVTNDYLIKRIMSELE